MRRRKPRRLVEDAGKGVKRSLTPEVLKDLYVDRHRTQSEIASEFGCTHQFVSRLLHEYGISRS